MTEHLFHRPGPALALAFALALLGTACDLGPQLPLPGAGASAADTYAPIAEPPKGVTSFNQSATKEERSLAGLCEGLPPEDYEKCRDLLDNGGEGPALPKPRSSR